MFYSSPLGSADHHTILPAPAYTLVMEKMEKVVKNVKQWIPDSIATLQGYLESTDWNNLLSSSSNVSEQVVMVSSYVTFCVGAEAWQGIKNMAAVNTTLIIHKTMQLADQHPSPTTSTPSSPGLGQITPPFSAQSPPPSCLQEQTSPSPWRRL